MEDTRKIMLMKKNQKILKPTNKKGGKLSCSWTPNLAYPVKDVSTSIKKINSFFNNLLYFFNLLQKYQNILKIIIKPFIMNALIFPISYHRI